MGISYDYPTKCHEILMQISDFISHFTGHLITYMAGLKFIYISKRGPRSASGDIRNQHYRRRLVCVCLSSISADSLYLSVGVYVSIQALTDPIPQNNRNVINRSWFIYIFADRKLTKMGILAIERQSPPYQHAATGADDIRHHFYQTRSVWSMDQGSNKKRSVVHDVVPTVIKFCVMWEGFLVTVGEKLLNGEWFSFDPWSMNQADLVW